MQLSHIEQVLHTGLRYAAIVLILCLMGAETIAQQQEHTLLQCFEVVARQASPKTVILVNVITVKNRLPQCLTIQ